MPLNEANKQILLDVARLSIENGYKTGYPLSVDLREYPSTLIAPAATFVTLYKNHEMRGSTGMLEAILPLAEDIAENAFSAAFKDPRFQPVEKHEIAELDIHLAILSDPMQLYVDSEKELMDVIRPGIDGVIVKEGPHHGNFLPNQWQQLPSKKDFLRHLKSKAGLPPDYWSDSIEFFSYTTEIIHAKDKNIN